MKIRVLAQAQYDESALEKIAAEIYTYLKSAGYNYAAAVPWYELELYESPSENTSNLMLRMVFRVAGLHPYKKEWEDSAELELISWKDGKAKFKAEEEYANDGIEDGVWETEAQSLEDLGKATIAALDRFGFRYFNENAAAGVKDWINR